MTAVLAIGMTVVATQAAAADVSDPVAFVEDRATAVLSKLDGKREQVRQDPEVAQRIVREELLPHIDVDYISRLVLGPHWRSASEEQRTRFQEAFQSFLLSSYAQGLADFTEDRLQVMPLRGEPNPRRTIVQTEVTRENGQAVPVAFTLHWTDGGWQLFDVIIEGISYVRNYRTDFNSEIEQKGLDSLIARLESNGAAKPGHSGDGPDTKDAGQ
ncbi:MAG TPA: ABC transporter substrate-binding protein [Gammaproteobacteria bacterium]